MKPESITFLRKEARAFYRQLSPVQKQVLGLGGEKKIFIQLKKKWKDGIRTNYEALDE